MIIGETTSQDLLLDLGPPLRKYVKEDDRMERIWGATQEGTSELALRSSESTKPGPSMKDQGNKADVIAFWNYFQYGMDFLISPEGEVQKILLHSNIVSPPHTILNSAEGPHGD